MDYLISLHSKSDYYLNHFFGNEITWKAFIIEYMRTQNQTPQDDIDKKYDFLVAWLEERIFKNHFLTVKVINRFILQEYILEKIFNLKMGKK